MDDHDFGAPRMNQRDRKRMLSYMLVLIVLIAGFVLFGRSSEDNPDRPFFLQDNGSIAIIDSKGSRSILRYAEMTGLRLDAPADFGEPITGGIHDGWREGLWHSEACGDYIACTETKVASAVVVTTSDAVFMLNVESDAATRALYEALIKQMPQGNSL